MKSISDIDTYIDEYPHETAKKLRQIRSVIRKAAPDATETFKYGLPTLVLHGNLVHYGGFKNHIGFYPTPSAILQFKKELNKYTTSKGAIQFPLDNPLPLLLITKIVKFRVKEVKGKIKNKISK